MQSSGLSLLSPEVTVYAANGSTVLASADGEGQYGTTLTVSVSGVTAGEQFYVKVQGADTTQMGTGHYALGLNFKGTTPPTEASPIRRRAQRQSRARRRRQAPTPFGGGPYTGAAAVISSITAADGSGTNGTWSTARPSPSSAPRRPTDTITVYCDGYLMGQTVALADNTWIFDNSSTPLGEGTYLFTAIATDPGGYSTTLSIPYAVTINTAATDPPAGGNGPGSTIDLAEDLGGLDQPVEVVRLDRQRAGRGARRHLVPVRADGCLAGRAQREHARRGSAVRRASSACTTTTPAISATRTTWTAIACWPRSRRTHRTGPWRIRRTSGRAITSWPSAARATSTSPP